MLDLPGSVVQPWVAVREDGLVAVSYHGSTLTGPLLNANTSTSWWPRTAVFEASEPSDPLAVVQLTEAPVYEGVFCNSSPECPEGSEEVPMKEFLSAAWGPQGSLYTAFTDATVEEQDETTDPEVGSPEGGRLTVRRLDVAGAPDETGEEGSSGPRGDLAPWPVGR